MPIDEATPTRPGSPYGASKLAVDTALAEHARMHGIGAVSLRYFNVAGAHAGADGTWLGERQPPGDPPHPQHSQRGAPGRRPAPTRADLRR
jgi:UDP-glucose 4-epimerase